MTALQSVGEAAGRACGLSPAPRMRYWQPAEHLRGLVSGYHLYAVAAPSGQIHRDVFQPAWANLRFRLNEDADWRVRMRDGEWIQTSPVTMFGPSSAVTWSESGTGLVVGAGILPRGWARLELGAAREWANRIGPLDRLAGEPAENHHLHFCEVVEDDDVPRLFDEIFTAALKAPGRDDAAIGRVEAALVDPAIGTVGELAARTRLSLRALERLTYRAFGFTPKLLLRRARFLRSLHAIRTVPPADRTAALDAGYTDYSHFVRDAQTFLGMSPGAFLRLDAPLLRESLALRAKVLGAPAQALAVTPHPAT